MNARTIYIVDDNASRRASGSAAPVLTFAPGAPARGDRGLVRRDRRERACLMLDVRMPQLSGLDVHDALRERGAQLPVIYMSGHADVPLAVQAMQKGAATLFDHAFAAERRPGLRRRQARAKRTTRPRRRWRRCAWSAGGHRCCCRRGVAVACLRWVPVPVSVPPIVVAAVLGLLIAFVQAATQLQEQTLQYVAKFFAIVITIFITASMLGGGLYHFCDRVFTSFAGLVCR